MLPAVRQRGQDPPELAQRGLAVYAFFCRPQPQRAFQSIQPPVQGSDAHLQPRRVMRAALLLEHHELHQHQLRIGQQV